MELNWLLMYSGATMKIWSSWSILKLRSQVIPTGPGFLPGFQHPWSNWIWAIWSVQVWPKPASSSPSARCHTRGNCWRSQVLFRSPIRLPGSFFLQPWLKKFFFDHIWTIHGLPIRKYCQCLSGITSQGKTPGLNKKENIISTTVLGKLELGEILDLNPIRSRSVIRELASSDLIGCSANGA